MEPSQPAPLSPSPPAHLLQPLNMKSPFTFPYIDQFNLGLDLSFSNVGMFRNYLGSLLNMQVPRPHPKRFWLRGGEMVPRSVCFTKNTRHFCCSCSVSCAVSSCYPDLTLCLLLDPETQKAILLQIVKSFFYLASFSWVDCGPLEGRNMLYSFTKLGISDRLLMSAGIVLETSACHKWRKAPMSGFWFFFSSWHDASVSRGRENYEGLWRLASTGHGWKLVVF